MIQHAIAILVGWTADKIWGDPAGMPHPVVWFGKAIASGEKRLNNGRHRLLKGALLSLSLTLFTFICTYFLLLLCRNVSVWLCTATEALLAFYGLAGTTLIREVRMVFRALDHSLAAGRQQVGRIVGRDTSQLDAQGIRKAALETLAENLSDGVIAPLFWLILLGIPGMMAYKMVNTLDSMIGYRTARYRRFGTVAARTDDVANWIPARLTALLMVLVAGRPRLLRFVWRNGRRHASPNSGYPESALAGILNCQFGGTHVYFGETIEKPFIGDHDRELNTRDMQMACRVNQWAEVVMIIITVLCSYLFH